MPNGQHSGRPINRKDRKGQYVLGEKLGEGGEGEVYEVSNDQEWAVKIYKPGKEPKGEQANKLIAMEGLMNSPDGERQGHPSLSWPKQIIRDRERNCLVGMVMTRVNTSRTMSIGEFWTPTVRQAKLSKMRMPSDRIHVQNTKWKIIRNLSKIMARVHQHGHLIGDINERNILVEPEHGTVSIIDCDSFQIQDRKNRIIYRCKVGRAEYTAPEFLLQMQGKCTIPKCPAGPHAHNMGFHCVRRTQEHDKFGIAVIFFQILMEGGHPYDCRIDEFPNAEANTRQEKIIKGYFPYSSSKPPFIHVNNQQNETRYSGLPQKVKDMFERAFRTPQTS